MPTGLKLQLSQLEHGTAQVRVVESPAGEPRSTLQAPFDAATVSGLLKILEKQSLSDSRLKDEELAALQALRVVQNGQLLGAEARNHLIGQQLFEALFPTSENRDHDVRGALETTLSLAQQKGEAVPFQLRFDSDAVELACLPWELICDPDGRHLVAEGRLRFTRYVTFGQAVAPLPAADYLEILVITPRPVDAAPIDPDAERLAIEQAFTELQAGHRVRVRHLRPPTRDALVSAVNRRPYHIVHFDGHGAFARRCPFCEQFQSVKRDSCSNPDCPGQGNPLDNIRLEGCLAFERGQNSPLMHLVGSKDLATVLSGRQVRLFVASGCQTGTLGGESVFASVGPRLILAGVPAIVAMQFSVPVQAAVRFASEFYAAVARGESIAAATAAGRRILFDGGMWYIPAIYLRNWEGEGFIFSQRTSLYLRPADARELDWASLRARDAAPYKFLSPYEITDRVVFQGRDADTRRVLEEVLHRRFTVLYGPPGVGKTSLINAGLGPELIQRGYSVLTVREYGNPVEMLRQEAVASSALDVDFTDVHDLPGLVRGLLRSAGQPLVVIFDGFDSFLRSASAVECQDFVAQFHAYQETDYPLHTCLLFVLRADALGGLQAFQADVPEIFHHLIPLAPLTREQARQAIERPLAYHRPPMRYDPVFLESTLLDALCAGAEADAINPTHLQIICSDLYQRALRESAAVIDAAFYPPGGAAAILNHYLTQTLAQYFPTSQERDLAQAVLKAMVSPTGERKFVTADQVARDADLNQDETRRVLDLLLKGGLLEPRTEIHGPVTYSPSHHLLAQEVSRWFDREEALVRCAQETLDRAWDDWYSGWYISHREASQAPSNGGVLLVGRNRLHEIHDRREHLSITAPQLCLLLRSAVHARIDTGYWAFQLQEDDQARELLSQIHFGPQDPPPGKKETQDQARLGAAALGLNGEGLGVHALARAAVAHTHGAVRHTAALALAALGLDVVFKEQQTLVRAAPSGRHWRRVQALAQMTTAGFPLPQLPLPLLTQVQAWQTGIRLFEARWNLIAQAIGAGLGGGVGLIFAMATVYLASGYYRWDELAAFLLVGMLIGALFAGGRWLLDTFVANKAGRALGGGVGFCLGLLAVAPFLLSLSGWQLVGGLLSGIVIALGWELLVDSNNTSLLWQAGKKWSALRRAGLGGGLAGALVLSSTALSPLRLPFVLRRNALILARLIEQPWLSFLYIGQQSLPLLAVVTAALTGAAIGAGLVSGGVIGQTLWKQLSDERWRSDRYNRYH